MLLFERVSLCQGGIEVYLCSSPLDVPVLDGPVIAGTDEQSGGLGVVLAPVHLHAVHSLLVANDAGHNGPGLRVPYSDSTTECSC